MADEFRVLEVDRGDYRRTRLLGAEVPEPGPGQALLRVDRFALTANNITYAAVGDLLDYWGFFPTEDPWGRIPAMGLASITTSAHPDIDEGGLYFGFYPIGTHLVVEPEARSDGFTDSAAHRANHAPPYRTYGIAGADPAFETATQDRYLLLRGLFLTSFLVDDFLDDNAFFGATTVVVTSASSKTSIALAHQLAKRTEIRTIGITSSANHEFVRGLGHFDSAITYDQLDQLDSTGPSVIVDMAGNIGLLAHLHRVLDDGLRYSCRVGGTHWEAMGGQHEIAGPAPTFFFAPTQITKRNAEWGAETFEATTAAALKEFIEDSKRWLAVERYAGPDRVGALYSDLVDNRMPPQQGAIGSMWAEASSST